MEMNSRTSFADLCDEPAHSGRCEDKSAYYWLNPEPRPSAYNANCVTNVDRPTTIIANIVAIVILLIIIYAIISAMKYANIISEGVPGGWTTMALNFMLMITLIFAVIGVIVCIWGMVAGNLHGIVATIYILALVIISAVFMFMTIGTIKDSFTYVMKETKTNLVTKSDDLHL